MRSVIIAVAIIGLFSLPALAESPDLGPPVVTDIYQISFGPQIPAIPGDPLLFIPIRINISRPVIGVVLNLNYDAAVLTPTLLAPNMFFQRFTYDLSLPGRIRMNLTTDLPPPPYIPPLFGDTLFAWISCHVTSRFIGFDYLTHITYFEDPFTPLPDNYVMFDNGDIMGGPYLELVDGDVMLLLPLYGDINLNGYPYEIADAVMFMQFFIGHGQFNRRQYANSDCNHDGAQATISDLVFLIRVLSGDTVLSAPSMPEPPENALAKPVPTSNSSLKTFDTAERCDIIVDGTRAMGGARFLITFDSTKIHPLAVVADGDANYMQIASSVQEGQLVVMMTNWDAANESFVNGRLFSIIYEGSAASSGEPFQIVNAEFSDNSGYPAAWDYRLGYSHSLTTPSPLESSLNLTSYPNPFNNSVAIGYSLPAGGNYQLMIYDILGRRTRTLFDGYRSPGPGAVIWDATDDGHSGVASGTYFARLQGQNSANNIKLFLLK